VCLRWESTSSCNTNCNAIQSASHNQGRTLRQEADVTWRTTSNLEWIDDSGLYTWDIDGMSMGAQFTSWKPRGTSCRALCELALWEKTRRTIKETQNGLHGWIRLNWFYWWTTLSKDEWMISDTIYKNWKWEKRGLTFRETRELLILSSSLDRRGRQRHLF